MVDNISVFFFFLLVNIQLTQHNFHYPPLPPYSPTVEQLLDFFPVQQWAEIINLFHKMTRAIDTDIMELTKHEMLQFFHT